MPSIRVLARSFVVTHTIAVVALSWPDWGWALLALVCWLFAAVGADEPQPTRSPRHRDVQAAERTRLGQKLMHREGWIVERPALALGLVALISIFTATAVLALATIDPTPLTIARVYVLTPALLLGAGFILSTMVNMWLVTGPILALWLVGLVAATLEGQWTILLRLLLVALAVFTALFALDLLRGARRGLERPRDPRTTPAG